ncbi:MAG: cobyrinate a,c-diamide synthase, partial [Thermodesulfobacteriota bacterium]|nr:cobyrinate a,c-diamide synthase [Thermodesulfobacteriota bacterium]
ILGGGYPELHCGLLSNNHSLSAEIKGFGMNGSPIYAECGGFMFLTREIRGIEGRSFPMVGLFPLRVQMEDRFKALGYREVVTRKESILGPPGTLIRGHEFHYSQIIDKGGPVEEIYSVTDRKNTTHHAEGFLKNRTLGSYIHQHWGSNPQVAGNFVEYCRRFGN